MISPLFQRFQRAVSPFSVKQEGKSVIIVVRKYLTGFMRTERAKDGFHYIE
jgi:hypothetical protein